MSSEFRTSNEEELAVLRKLAAAVEARGNNFIPFATSDTAETVLLAGVEFEAGEFKILADSFLVKPDDKARGLWVTMAGQLAIGLLLES